MNLIIDNSGNVLMFSETSRPTPIPGAQLVTLDPVQSQAFKEIQNTPNSGITFIEGSFDVKPLVPIEPTLTPQQKITAMERDGIPAEKIDGGYIRGIREYMLGMAQIVAALGGPDVMVTPGMQKVKKLDDAIKVQRALIQ